MVIGLFGRKQKMGSCSESGKLDTIFISISQCPHGLHPRDVDCVSVAGMLHAAIFCDRRPINMNQHPRYYRSVVDSVRQHLAGSKKTPNVYAQLNITKQFDWPGVFSSES